MSQLLSLLFVCFRHFQQPILGGYASNSGVCNTLGGFASHWHLFTPAFATCSGASPRIGIYSPRCSQHARGLSLTMAYISPGVRNTLGGFASHWHLFAPAFATRSGGFASHWHLFAPAFATRSGASPHIGIYPPQRSQHARGTSPRIGIYSPSVGNTLGGCT
jgi:hypothetical protein